MNRKDHLAGCAKCGGSTGYRYYRSIFDAVGIGACNSHVDEVNEMVRWLWGWVNQYATAGHEAEFEQALNARKSYAQKQFAKWKSRTSGISTTHIK